MTELKNVAQVKENIERDYLQKLNVERNRKNGINQLELFLLKFDI